MAEAFAIATGAFACLTAAEFFFKCHRSIYRSAKMIKGARDDIFTFANHVELFGGLMGTVRVALKPYVNKKQQDAPQTLQYLVKKDVLTMVFNQVKTIQSDVRYFVPILRNLRTIPRWLVIVQLVFRKREIEAITIKMKSVKSSLQLVMTSIQLENAREQPRCEESTQEIKRLKREIKAHVRTISFLVDKLGATTTPHHVDQFEKFLEINHEISFTLHELGTSVVKERRVPGFPASTGPLTAATISSRTLSFVPESSSSGMNMNVRSFENLVRYNSSSSVSRHGSTPVVSALHDALPLASAEVVATLQDQDYVAVRENAALLHIDTSRSYEVETGHIIVSSEYEIVNAKLIPDLDENIITQSLIAELGLTFEPIDSVGSLEDGMWIQVGDGKRERCIGQLSLQWSAGRESCQPTIPVHCWVCVHASAVGDLILGRPYVEKKAHYIKGKQRQQDY